MRRLLTLKQALITLEELDFAASEGEESEDDDFSDDPYGVEMKWDNLLGAATSSSSLWQDIQRHGLDDDELDELMADAKQDELDSVTPRKKKKPNTKEKKEKLPPKKKRKVDKEAAQPIFDLEEPEWVPSTKKSASRNKNSETEDAYGEATHLQDADAADKSARKKTLRFHTSKIESASARRNAARNQAAGGDDDIPYRERKKERDLRLAQETKNRLAKQGGEDLDDIDPEMPSDKRKRADSDDDGSGDESPDEYYELIKKKSSDKKAKKKAHYEAARAAEKYVPFTSSSRTFALTLISQAQFHRGRLNRTSVPNTGDFKEQGTDTSPFKISPQPPCQKAAEVRKGQEEGLVSKGRLQGWSCFDGRSVRRRGIGYIEGCQRCSAWVVSVRVYMNFAFTLPFLKYMGVVMASDSRLCINL
jgi:U3 small nucleolar RNA-associated protein 3